MESPGAHVGDWRFTRPFLLCSFFLWAYTPGEGSGMNCKKGSTTKIKAQVPSIWAKGCILRACVCVIGLDMTTSPR